MKERLPFALAIFALCFIGTHLFIGSGFGGMLGFLLIVPMAIAIFSTALLPTKAARIWTAVVCAIAAIAGIWNLAAFDDCHGETCTGLGYLLVGGIIPIAAVALITLVAREVWFRLRRPTIAPDN